MYPLVCCILWLWVSAFLCKHSSCHLNFVTKPRIMQYFEKHRYSITIVTSLICVVLPRFHFLFSQFFEHTKPPCTHTSSPPFCCIERKVVKRPTQTVDFWRSILGALNPANSRETVDLHDLEACTLYITWNRPHLNFMVHALSMKTCTDQFQYKFP